LNSSFLLNTFISFYELYILYENFGIGKFDIIGKARKKDGGDGWFIAKILVQSLNSLFVQLIAE
jgi:hypothetical protein